MKQIRVAIGIICRESQILIARRKLGDTFGGFWEFPGGKVEAGETIENALIRELNEELALTCVILEMLPAFTHAYSQVTIELHPFIVEPVAGEAKAIDSEEIRWVSPSELGDFQFPPANAELIRQVQSKFRAE